MPAAGSQYEHVVARFGCRRANSGRTARQHAPLGLIRVLDSQDKADSCGFGPIKLPDTHSGEVAFAVYGGARPKHLCQPVDLPTAASDGPAEVVAETHDTQTREGTLADGRQQVLRYKTLLGKVAGARRVEFQSGERVSRRNAGATIGAASMAIFAEVAADVVCGHEQVDEAWAQGQDAVET